MPDKRWYDEVPKEVVGLFYLFPVTRIVKYIYAYNVLLSNLYYL